jgi:MtN3 and saliva related transmembrane protein
MELINIIGWLAIITTTLRLLPQIIKSYKTKKVRDVSLTWEIVGVLSSFFWTWYAYLNNDKMLQVGAGILTLSYIILIIQKFVYENN